MPKAFRRSLARTLLLLTQGALTLAIFHGLALSVGLRHFRSAWPLVLVLLALLLITLLHEAGHVVAGWWAGYRLVQMQVAFVQVNAVEGGLRLKLTPNPLRGAGGFTVMAPTRLSRLRRRSLAMSAGGPAASLLSGLLVVGLFAVVVEAGVWGRFFLGFWGFNSLAVGALNLVPFQTGSVMSDGGRIWRLLRGGPHADYLVASNALLAMLHDGLRPRDFPPGLVAQVTALGDGSLQDLNGHLLAYTYADDRSDYAAAERHLHYALEKSGGHAPAALLPLYMELTTFTALVRRDAAAAQSYYAHTQQTRIDPRYRLIPEAALALAKGDHATARRKARAALRAFEGPTLTHATAQRILEEIP